MASLFVDGRFQGLDSAGIPVSAGLLYSYAAGTLSPLSTYTTQAGDVANANPVVLDSAGRASVWLGASSYRVILKTSAGVTLWDTDNISAAEADVTIFTPAGAGAELRTTQSKLRESVSVLDFIPTAEHAAITAGTTTYDATAGIQAAIDSGATEVLLPEGKLEFTQIVHKPGLQRFIGKGQASGGSGTYLQRRTGATGAAYVWDGTNRITGARVGGFRMDGNSEAAETYGLDLSGFSYCTFEDMWIRVARLDGIYADGSTTPTQKQFSNNTFINVRANNNLRDGWRFEGSIEANSANVYIGCEGAGNAGVGFNEITGYSNETVGCTFQGNTGRDFYTNGTRNKHSFYVEGNSKALGSACELGTGSSANSISTRSSYPLWNTFKDGGVNNNVSVRGEDQVENHIFTNPYFLNWLGPAPVGVTLNGTPTVASYTDAVSPFGAGMQLTITANFQGVRFGLSETGANIQGRHVTLILEIETSGVVDTLQNRVYARDGTTDNTTTGEFAAENLEVSTAGKFITLAYDVKFAASVSGSPSVFWYMHAGVVGSNVIKVRSARVVLGQTRTISQFYGVETQPSVTTSTLSAASNGINTHRKTAGRMAYESSTGKLRFALGSSANSAWRATDGTGDVTPV